MSQAGPQRSLQPRQGWHNIFTAQACGEAPFKQGNLYEASYHNRPIFRLIYNPKDHELTGRSAVTVRCMLCGVKTRALDAFSDYPLIGTVDVNTIRLTLKMSTERILKHVASQHGEDFGGVDDADFFNSILDCCNL